MHPRAANSLAAIAALTFVAAPTAFAMSRKPPVQPAATSSSAVDADAVWVGKSDEAKSCAKDRGVPLDEMGAPLESAGIKILSKKKVPDGKMRIQMCGADKGEMNGYQISRKDLDKAKELGFQLVFGSH